jgi:hypothetical protein
MGAAVGRKIAAVKPFWSETEEKYLFADDHLCTKFVLRCDKTIPPEPDPL